MLAVSALISNIGHAQIPLSGDIVTNTTASAPEMGSGFAEYNLGPDIECNEDGRYTIAWVQDVSTNYPPFHKAYKRGYDDLGNPISANQDVINPMPPTAYGGSDYPKVAMKPNGDYIIVYYEYASSVSSPTSERIYFHKYFANGVQNGGRVFVDYGEYADIDIAADGTFNISYKGRTSSNNSLVYVKRYTAAGTLAGPRITVDAVGTAHYDTNIQSRNNNGFTVCYKPDGTQSNLNFRTFSSGINTSSNVMSGRYMSKRNFIYKPNGDIVAVSVNNHYGYNNPQVNFKNKISRFTPGGAVSEVFGSEIVTAVTDYRISYPSIETNVNGDYVIAFPKYENNHPLGIYLQQYNVNDQPVGPEYPVSTVDNTMDGVMLDVAGCSFVVTWINRNDEKIYHKRFRLYDEQFEITGNDTICSGDTSLLTATGGYTHYQWSYGNGATATTQSITASTPGIYTVTAWNEAQDECSPTATFELTVNPSPKIVLPSVFVACNGLFTGVCGPIPPNGATFSYEWWGPTQGGSNSTLLSEGQCYTPLITGSYLLEVTNEDTGCSSYHTFTVVDQIVQPDLGPDLVVCEGDPVPQISVAGQGYDYPNYGITWYHNGDQVQVGGETLMTSFTSGTVTVEISYLDCVATDSIDITVKECCPTDIGLEIDCDRSGVLAITNIPEGIFGVTSWSFNGDHISPQSIWSPIWSPTQGEGTYSVVVLFDLDSGETCKYELSIEYTEDYCCKVNGSQASVHLLSAMGAEDIAGTPYGDMSIPVVDCDVIMDGSASTCESAYFISIAEFDYNTWSNIGNPLYTGWTQGEAPSSIDLAQYANFQGGFYYMVQFAVGPDWDAEYILFKYIGSKAEVSMLNVNNYQSVPDTPYGPMEVPAMCGRVALDGSLSTCEDAYYLSIVPWDPVSWSGAAPSVYQGWIQGQAPNNIDLTQSPFNLAFDNGTFYHVTFAVGPDWDPEYLLFWYNCDTRKEMVVAPNPSRGEFTISVTNNEGEGTLEVMDLSGNTVFKGTVYGGKPTQVDISRSRSGIYIVRVLFNDEVLTGRIVKQ